MEEKIADTNIKIAETNKKIGEKIVSHSEDVRKMNVKIYKNAKGLEDKLEAKSRHLEEKIDKNKSEGVEILKRMDASAQRTRLGTPVGRQTSTGRHHEEKDANQEKGNTSTGTR